MSATAAVLLFFVVSPKGQASLTPTSAFIDSAAHELALRTRLTLKSVEQAGIDPNELARCSSQERVACWKRTIAVADPRPDFLLVLAVHPAKDNQDELVPILLDVDAIDAEPLEPRLIETSSTEALRAYFASLFDRELRTVFEQRGVWGAREPAPVAIVAPPPVVKPRSIAPTIALIGGAGIAAIGAALTVYGLAQSDDGVMQACLARPGSNDACASSLSPIAFGIGIFAAGGVTAILGWLFGQEDEADAR